MRDTHASILVIDDEEIIREALEALLTRGRLPRDDRGDRPGRARRHRHEAGRRRPARSDAARQERHRGARRDPADRRRAAGDHDHGVRHDRKRGGRDQAGRVLLLHEAVQERRSAGRAAQRDRAAPARAREPRAARPAARRRAPLRRNHRRQREDEVAVRPDRPRGAEPGDRAHSGRERHGQGAGRARVPPAIRPAPTSRSSPSTPATCRRTCSNRTCSATSKARSPARSSRRRACSSWPTRARSSSTRSATSRSTRSRSCCA